MATTKYPVIPWLKVDFKKMKPAEQEKVGEAPEVKIKGKSKTWVFPLLRVMLQDPLPKSN